MLLLRFVDAAFQIYFLMLLARVLLSWVPEFKEYKIAQFICYYTDPYLNLFRRFIPPIGMIDISAIFAFIALGLVEGMIKRIIIAFL